MNDLENYNADKELNEFLYLISHDFNAPLRHIREFSGLLVSKLGDRLTDQEIMYVKYMQSGVEQAESMLDALLTYSRLTTVHQETTEFQSSEVVDEICRQLTGSALITNSGDVPIRGNRSHVTELFRALIDNGIKFSGEHDAQIHIEGERLDKGCLFTITDHGQGVPSSNSEKIFRMFMQGSMKTEGVGLGLALVEKICRLHGGSVWLEHSEPGQTVFRFELMDQSIG